MVHRWSAGAIWAVPLAWTALAAVATRSGRVDLHQAVVATAVVLLGVGGFRAAAGSRGGIVGRLAELVLVGTAVGWLLAEPASHRIVVSLAGALASATLSLVAVWSGTGSQGRLRLAALAGATTGVLVASGLDGGPSRWLIAGGVIAAAAGTSWLLALASSAEVAVLVVVGLGPALGASAPGAWLLPLVAAAALFALSRDLPVPAAVLAVAAALLPPAGLAVALGLVVGLVRRNRSVVWLSTMIPVAAIAAWRMAAVGMRLEPGLSWEGIAAALPLEPTAFPFLVPLAVMLVIRRRAAAADTRDVLLIGLLLMPLLGKGPWAAGAGAALWLFALPAEALTDRDRRLLRATAPWTVGVALAFALLLPWGGLRPVGFDPALLAVGWAAALLISLLPHPVARVAWALPLSALLYVAPVEGVDVHLAPGERLELPAPAGRGWVFQIGLEGGDPPANGSPALLATGHGAEALRTGVEAPLSPAATSIPLLSPHPLAAVRGHDLRGLAVRTARGPTTWEAAVPLVVRAEALEHWQERRRRLMWLLGGAFALVLAAHLVPGAAPLPCALALGAVVAALAAAGSTVAPLARAGFRDIADVAAVAWLGAWAALLPRLRQRRFVAGLLLLAPLATAQVALRPAAGDEVYHLELMQSLVEDGDLDPSNNLDLGNPGEAVYARHGADLIHSPILAIAGLPGFALAGRSGAYLLPALLVAAAAALAARRARQLGAPERSVEMAWGMVLLTYPALTFATQIWPAAAGMFLFALLLVAVARPSPVGAAVVAALALLVKVRLGLVALPMAAASALRRGRASLLALGAAAALALVGVAALLGTPLGRHRLAELVPPDPLRPFVALWGLICDPAGGLLFAAPLWLVAALGLRASWRRGAAGERALMVGGAVTVLALLPRGEWYGGGSPPARYLAPLLPLALLALVEVVRSRRGRALISLALPWAAVVAWVAVTRPLWLFNPVDGGWWLADGLARGLSVGARGLFPTLLRPGPAMVAAPLVLGLLAWTWHRRTFRCGAALTMVLMAGAVAWGVGVTEATVHVEDPQVRHLGGAPEPPPGSFNRAAHAISWRLPPGAEVAIPWRPRLGKPLWAVVRVDGGDGVSGRLLTHWAEGEEQRQRVTGGQWHRVALRPPGSLGASVLHLRWEAAVTGESGDLLVDRVEAAR